MLSRSALEDFDTFLFSDSRGGGSDEGASDPVVDVVEETFDPVEEGDVKFDENVDDGWRVFLTESGGRDGRASPAGGSVNAWLKEGRGFRGVLDRLLLPPDPLVRVGSVSARLDAADLPGAMLGLALRAPDLGWVSALRLGGRCGANVRLAVEVDLPGVRWTEAVNSGTDSPTLGQRTDDRDGDLE
jgi:hypothetical protein